MGRKPAILPLCMTPEISLKSHSIPLRTKVSLSLRVCDFFLPLVSVNFSNWLESSHKIYFYTDTFDALRFCFCGKYSTDASMQQLTSIILQDGKDSEEGTDQSLCSSFAS